MLHIAVGISLLGAGIVNCHETPHMELFGSNLRIPLLARGRSHDQFVSLDSRQANGMTCGTQNGGTSCPAGYCCDQYGKCGTGRAFCDAPYCQYQYGPACDANATPTGANTSSVPRPQIGSVPYGSAGLYNCTIPGTVALTYDDGPYIYTTSLLDELDSAGAKATFFITGNNFGKKGIDNASTEYPSIIRRMHKSGHQIGSHTWSHQNLEESTHYQRMDQMIKNEMAFNNILGFFPTYMRPPYDDCKIGSGCRTDVASLGYHIVEYTLDTYDYDNSSPDLIQNSKNNVSKVISASDSTVDQYIVYAHDTYEQTATNLTDFIIKTIKQKGYRFVTIGECLGDAEEYWYRNGTTGEHTAGVIDPTNTTGSTVSGSAQATPTATATFRPASSAGSTHPVYFLSIISAAALSVIMSHFL